jgi:hypothetical protein
MPGYLTAPVTGHAGVMTGQCNWLAPAAAAAVQGCLPDKLFAAFRPIPREDAAEGVEDPFEPSELPGSGATQDEGDMAE